MQTRHKRMMYWRWPQLVAALLAIQLGACAMMDQAHVPPKVSAPSVPVTPPARPQSATDKASMPADTTQRSDTAAAVSEVPANQFMQRSAWQNLTGMAADNLLASWPTWLKSCQVLKKKPEWQSVCQQALLLNPTDAAAQLQYWQTQFDVYQLRQANGDSAGLMTGYYQPILHGAISASGHYTVPLYQAPADLIQVNLSALYPELKYKRLRGRLQGQSLVPYFSRAEIDQRPSPLQGQELLWVDDAVEAFFLQVQGSGIVLLENGERVAIGYAEQNGHPYQSIGKILVERGELRVNEASMQGIKQWGKQHPDQLPSLLNSNPSYVFFKRLPPGLSGPLGALGVPLTAARSIAIDPAVIPLGAPVYMVTTYPNSQQPLQQLMFAQDTGGAIKGAVRADIYWGEGESAGKLAGAMRQSGQLWVWLPKGYPVSGNP